jgi:predicted GNAT family acetyltransferase
VLRPQPEAIRWRGSDRCRTVNSYADDGRQARFSLSSFPQGPADRQSWHARRPLEQFVLTERDRPVAYSAFNAALPDMVQSGGVWTPPEPWGCGYGRMALAGSLLTASTKGADRAVLFPDDANLAARRA